MAVGTVCNVIGPRGGTPEAQGYNFKSGIGGAIDTGIVRPGSGDASFRFAQSGFLRWLYSDSQKYGLSFAFRPDMNRSVFTQDVMRIYDNATTNLQVRLRMQCGPSGAAPNYLLLHMTDSASLTTIKQHPLILANSSWYHVQLSINTSANPWVCEWKVKHDDSDIYFDGPQGTLAAAATNMRWHQIGPDTSAFGWNYNIQDIVVCQGDVGFPGDFFVDAVYPASTGTHVLDASPSTIFFKDNGAVETALTTLDTNGDGPSFGYIDDQPVFNDASRVEVHGAAATKWLEWGFITTGIDPSYVKAVAAMLQETPNTTDALKLQVVEGVDIEDVIVIAGGSAAINSGTVVYKFGIVLPPSGGSWSLSRLNAAKIRFGVVTAATGTPHLESLIFHVARFRNVVASTQQRIAPGADISKGSWTGFPTNTTIYVNVDETTRDVNDFIESASSPAVADIYKFRLAAAGNPVQRTGHTLRISGMRAAPGDNIQLTVKLYAANGSTLIKSFTPYNLDDNDTIHELTLTELEATAIPDADYVTGLVVQLEALKV